MITPWNLVVKEGRLALLDGIVALDPSVDGFDKSAIHPDALDCLAPEVVDAIDAGKPIPASAAADVYAQLGEGFAPEASAVQEWLAHGAGE